MDDKPYLVDFNRPTMTGNELGYMTTAVEHAHISGDGMFTQKARNFLETLLGVPRVLLTTSCTHALEMCALLLDLQPGDEVILPSFTFVSTANAFALRGACPVFCDIRSDTLNLDETRLERLITPRTRAVVPVHYAGVGCEMDTIKSIAEEHGLVVIEDNAHGLFGKYRGQYLGTLGSLATQSFHETKNITCGEGGALLINDPAFTERAEIIREKGTNRSRFFRGQVDKYTWVDLGSSYLPSDLLAAYLFAQLEMWQTIQSRRKEIWEIYDRELKTWAPAYGIQNSDCPRTHRAGLPHVLFAAARPGDAPGIDCPFETAPHPECVPLPAPALIGNGPKIRWQTRRLPGHRISQRPVNPPAVL